MLQLSDCELNRAKADCYRTLVLDGDNSTIRGKHLPADGGYVKQLRQEACHLIPPTIAPFPLKFESSFGQ